MKTAKVVSDLRLKGGIINMVQFYISSGVIIAAIILQFMILKTAIHTKNSLATEATLRVKPRKPTSINSLQVFKMVIIFTVLLFFWSVYLVIAYKELFIGVVFLTFLLCVIGLILLANNLIVSVGFKNEVQLTKVTKINFEFPENTIKYLKKQELGVKLGMALIVYTNTLGLYASYALFNDSLWFNVINLLLTFFAYFGIYKSLNNQHRVVFANQKESLTDEEVKDFLKESKEKYTLSTDDIKRLLEKDEADEKPVEEKTV